MELLKSVDGWWAINEPYYSVLRKDNTELSSDEDGSIEVHEDVPGYNGYSSRTYLSLEVVRELLRAQGYKVVKDNGL